MGGGQSMLLVLKYVCFAFGCFVLFWVNSTLKRDKRGDERTKHIAQLAGLSAWNTITTVAGLQTLLLMLRLDFPFLHKIQNPDFPSLFILLIIFYLISYGFHYLQKS
jgi:hypothetical protein